MPTLSEMQDEIAALRAKRALRAGLTVQKTSEYVPTRILRARAERASLENLSHKQKYGRCEDAPCCGCCGQASEASW